MQELGNKNKKLRKTKNWNYSFVNKRNRNIKQLCVYTIHIPVYKIPKFCITHTYKIITWRNRWNKLRKIAWFKIKMDIDIFHSTIIANWEGVIQKGKKEVEKWDGEEIKNWDGV